jgi:hypothetical protein
MDTTSPRADLWFAFLSGPCAWALHETLSYILARPACAVGLLPLEYVVTIGALAVTGYGLYLALRVHRGRLGPPETTPRFLAAAAIVLNALFGYAIIMEAIPNAVVSPCL